MKLICIGGPCAGEKVEADADRPGYQIKVRGRMPRPTTFSAEPENIADHGYLYMVQRLNMTTGHITFLVPPQQTALKTIELLLEAYARDAEVRKHRKGDAKL